MVLQVTDRGVNRNLLRGGSEKDFLHILRESHGEDLFWGINILSAVPGDLSVSVTRIMAEKDI